jgi:putative ABC transport system permease protein
MRWAVDIGESFAIAFDAIRANKARGALTTLGIIIGIVAVIYVSRMPWVMMEDFFHYRNRPPLDLREARVLERNLQGRAIVNPTMETRRNLKFMAETMEGVSVIGTTEKQNALSTARPEFGRFLMPFDVTYKKSVCVIGTDVREGLFGSANPINKKMKIGRTTYRVIGVMEKQGGGTFGGPNFDRVVYIPITSYVKAFGGHRGQDVNVAVKAPSQKAMEDLEFLVIGEMRKVRKLRPSDPDNFSINKLDSLLGAFDNVMGVVLLVGLLVTSISLFVGGVGVMNIMFVSVTERTHEIGIRKAIGAKRHAILLQFLFESAVICLLGGLIGNGLAWVLTAIINATLMPASISVPIMFTAMLVSLVVGVVAGFVPALKGARLDPIVALRYE